MAILVAVLCAALVILAPAEAFAWGPGVHLHLGNFLLDNPDLLPKPLIDCVFCHSRAFLYGMLAADFFIGKGSKPKPGHSHNWDVAHTLLERADSPRSRAYALGYVGHLAADVAAHNYFAPGLMLKFPGAKLMHGLCEWWADASVDWGRREAKRILDRPFSRIDERLLAAAGKGKGFYLFRRALFRRSVGFITDRRITGRVGRLPVPGIDRDWLGRTLHLSAARVIDAIKRPADSPVFGYDPIGAANLALAGRTARLGGGDRETLFAVPVDLDRLRETLPICINPGGLGAPIPVTLADPS